MNTIKEKLLEPSTWAGGGFAVSLFTVIFGAEKGQVIGGVVGGLIALYEIIRRERSVRPH